MSELSIRPSKDLRSNYAQISALTRKNPVAITVNGKEDTVILSHEDYMRQQSIIAELEEKLDLYRHLCESQDDIRLGRVQSAQETFNDIKSAIDGLDL